MKKAESFDRLHTTLENSRSHGVGGWLVHDQVRFGGHAIQMTESNTMWYALLWIFPGHDMAIVVATNSGAPDAFQTCDKAVAKLMGEFRN